MLTLTNGFKKPQANDPGSIVFPAMEDNIQQLNDHTHDGTDSEKLPSSSVESVTQNILAAGWGALTAGHYSQNITLPVEFSFDTVSMEFRTSAGIVVYPTVLKVSSSVYTVSVNDNTLALKVIYG